MRKTRWSKEEISFLKDSYASKPKQYMLDNLNKSWDAIKLKARRLDLERPYKFKMQSGTNHYFFDHHSKESAYVLGLICADGSMNRTTSRIEISTKLSDIKMLNNIRNLICPGKRIYTKNRCGGFIGGDSKYAQLDICSRYLYNKVKDFGIYPNKSTTMMFPKIPEIYMSHFIRGYFDGDGCIYFNENNKNKHLIYFCGSLPFLTSVGENITRELLISSKKMVRDGEIFRTTYYSCEARKICDWMYSDSDNLRLDRKYNVFMSLKETL